MNERDEEKKREKRKFDSLDLNFSEPYFENTDLYKSLDFNPDKHMMEIPPNTGTSASNNFISSSILFTGDNLMTSNNLLLNNNNNNNHPLVYQDVINNRQQSISDKTIYDILDLQTSTSSFPTNVKLINMKEENVENYNDNDNDNDNDDNNNLNFNNLSPYQSEDKNPLIIFDHPKQMQNRNSNRNSNSNSNNNQNQQKDNLEENDEDAFILKIHENLDVIQNNMQYLCNSIISEQPDKNLATNLKNQLNLCEKDLRNKLKDVVLSWPAIHKINCLVLRINFLKQQLSIYDSEITQIYDHKVISKPNEFVSIAFTLQQYPQVFKNRPKQNQKKAHCVKIKKKFPFH